MTTAFDVPPHLLIERAAEDFKTGGKVTPPEWAPFVRTGVHTENAPRQRDWWYRRLAAEFGGKRDDGSAPSHPRAGSRSIIRECLQQLETLGLVAKAETKGRRVTPAGRKLLDNLSHQILLELAAKNPELTKYTRTK